MERRDKIINGKCYTLLVPPVTQAIPISCRLAALIAPLVSGGLGAAFDGSVEGESAKEKITRMVGPTLVSLTEALGKVDPVAAEQILRDAVVAGRVHCDEAPVSAGADFERHFSAHRADVYPVMTWALWECVRDFFPKLEGSPLQGVWETAKSAWKSPKGGSQTGGSGAPAGKGCATGGASSPGTSE